MMVCNKLALSCFLEFWWLRTPQEILVTLTLGYSNFIHVYENEMKVGNRVFYWKWFMSLKLDLKKILLRIVISLLESSCCSEKFLVFLGIGSYSHIFAT